MKKYKDDYEIVVKPDEEGREKELVVYRGEYFEVTLDENCLHAFKRKSLLLLVAAVVSHVAGGFISNMGMYQLYVALPYVLAYFPLLLIAEGVMRLPKEKRTYRRDEIELSFDRVKNNSRVLFILLGVGVLGEILFILFAPVNVQNLLEYLYLALEMIATAAVYILVDLQRKICIKPCIEPSRE